MFSEITCTVEMPHLELNTENHVRLQATLPTEHACYRFASQLMTHVQLETRGWPGARTPPENVSAETNAMTFHIIYDNMNIKAMNNSKS